MSDIPRSYPLESVVLASLLDDGISPEFIHQRLINPEGPFLKYLAGAGLDPPGPQEIAAILGTALVKGLVSCRRIVDDYDEQLRELPPGPHEPEALAFELWFELTPDGESAAEAAMEHINGYS